VGHKKLAIKFRPSLAIEVTPIERWLELELGVNAFRVSGTTQWETDLIFNRTEQCLCQARHGRLRVGSSSGQIRILWWHRRDDRCRRERSANRSTPVQSAASPQWVVAHRSR